MSQLAGKPVRLQFMRWDEHGWDNYGPAHTVDMHGGIDANGNIVGYDYNGWQIPYYTILTPSRADRTCRRRTRRQGFTGCGYIDTTNTGAQYTIPNRRGHLKSVPR